MRTIITLSVATALSTLLLVGCGASNSAIPTNIDAKKIGRTFMSEHMVQNKVSKLIKDAGEVAGWKMTEFKSNELIAEKSDGENTKSVTVNFDNSSFELSPHDSELQGIIETALGM